MLVKDVMTSPPIMTSEDATLEDTARLMLEKRVGGLPVLNASGELVGFVTETDFAGRTRGVPFSFITAPQVLGEWLGKENMERIYAHAKSMRVGEIMAHPAICIDENEPVEQAVRKMLKHDINRIVATRNGEPIGIVARRDMLRILVRDA